MKHCLPGCMLSSVFEFLFCLIYTINLGRAHYHYPGSIPCLKVFSLGTRQLWPSGWITQVVNPSSWHSHSTPQALGPGGARFNGILFTDKSLVARAFSRWQEILGTQPSENGTLISATHFGCMLSLIKELVGAACGWLGRGLAGGIMGVPMEKATVKLCLLETG